MPGLQETFDAISKGCYIIAGIVLIISLVLIGLSISNENPQQRSSGFLFIGGAIFIYLAGTLFSQVPGWVGV